MEIILWFNMQAGDSVSKEISQERRCEYAFMNNYRCFSYFLYLLMMPSSVSFTFNVTNLPLLLSFWFLPFSWLSIWKKGDNYCHISVSESVMGTFPWGAPGKRNQMVLSDVSNLFLYCGEHFCENKVTLNNQLCCPFSPILLLFWGPRTILTT